MTKFFRELLKKISYNIIKISPKQLYPFILKILYKIKIGHKLNLKNPQSYTEKIQWTKLYDKNPMRTLLADKYEVRKYVENKIGVEYLIPLLGVWDKFEDINFDKLPNKFVLKCTHGSAMNIIVKDKTNIDRNKICTQISKWLNTNLAYIALELHYKDIKPRIIAEKFIESPNDNLKDYKIMLFNGNPKFIWIDSDRFLNHTRTFYDLNWNFLPFWADAPLGKNQDKPMFIDEMLALSIKLSQNFAHERIDFYFANNRIYFGEFTLTPWSGLAKFHPEDYDIKLGNMFQLYR